MMSFRIKGPLLAMAVVLTACSGSNRTDQKIATTPTDPGLDSARQLARFALRNAQHEQAVILYSRVLARAYARDDAAAIGDIGYEYALALLRNGSPKEAVTQASKTRHELERRNFAPFAELYLVEAVANYALTENLSARAMAQQAIKRAAAGDQATRGRANFILGMIAADTEDLPALNQVITAMGAPTDSALQADLAEIIGRRQMLEGNSRAALSRFELAAELRQNLREYTGMARALAASGAAAKAAGDNAVAADRYYRAGRSAAVQRDRRKAVSWLTEALTIAESNGFKAIETDARDQLRALKKQE